CVVRLALSFRLVFQEVQVSHAVGQGGRVNLGAIRQDDHGEAVIGKALNGGPKSYGLAIMRVAAMPVVGIQKPSKAVEGRKAAVQLLRRSAVSGGRWGQGRLHFLRSEQGVSG